MRRDPDDPFDDIFNEIERMMDDVMGGGDAGPSGDTHVDVHEYDDRVVVIADLPGVTKEEIDLQCDGETLSISARGDSRTYEERVRLPARVDERSATATYNNGVLEIEFDRDDDAAGIDVQ